MSETTSDPTAQRFSSRLSMLLAVLGIAVGTGNIWRFPRIAAQSSGEEGAGAFLLVWFVFLFLWSIPLIIAEFALGKRGRKGVIGTFVAVGGPGYAWMGAFVGFASAAIMFYYSVVAGWCIYYFLQMLTTDLPLETAAAQQIWDGFQGSNFPVMFHALVMSLGAVAVWKGIHSIERVNLVLIPALLLIVVLAVVRALTLNGSWDGMIFLFTPDWSTIGNPRLWIEALTQNAFDTGAGWGLILTYGAYMQSRHGIVKNALITGIGNNLVSLLAAIMVFGTVFAILGATMSRGEILDVMQSSGPASTGLTFIWMPQLFARMPGGEFFAILFFLALSFAAFSSLISMIQLVTRIVVDFGVDRSHAILGVCIAGFVLGTPSAMNLGFLANQDFVWGVGLLISGLFIAFLVIRLGIERFRLESIDNVPDDLNAGHKWDLAIRFGVPVFGTVLLAWWLYQAAAVFAPDRWYDPFNPYSIMTCLVQWGIVIVAFRILNRWMADRLLSRQPTLE
ncbi:MAG: sodium-dependent transporter [Gammaproteobacteria bacterium]|nr:sodium-dependent transporter [Gammaproteobacteria bacterium]